MPGLNTQLTLATARARFCSFQLRLPTVVGARGPQPNIASAGVRLGGPTLNRGAARPMSCPPAMFLPASNDARDIELQRVSSDAMDSYLSRMCDAIGQAHTSWRQRAMLVNVVINGPQASGGSLVGAGFGQEIRQYAPRENSWQRPRTEAIAAAIGIGWDNWQRSVSLPGLPLYPAFAAVPSPVAPPMPNVPVPLVALVQIGVSLNSSQLKILMTSQYSGDNEWPNELFDALASGFERAFQVWAPSQMVTNIMGTGPVPTFAPPYVPVGPVVGGIGTQTPGAWSA